MFNTHETRQYVVRTTQPQEVEDMKKLYDKIVAVTGDKKTLDELLGVVYAQGKEAAREEDAHG